MNSGIDFKVDLQPALQWMCLDQSLPTQELRNLARKNGLIVVTASQDHWKFDGKILKLMVLRAIAHGVVPKSGAVICGIGEMLARSNSDEDFIKKKFGQFLRGRMTSRRYVKILNEVIEISASKVSKFLKRQDAVYKIPSVNINDWSEIRIVANGIDTIGMNRTFGYGLGFVVELLLAQAPSNLNYFSKKGCKKGLGSAILGAVGGAVAWDDEIAIQAIKTHIPPFVLLGVLRLNRAPCGNSRKSALEIDETLVKFGISSEGRAHVSAQLLKAAVCRWNARKAFFYQQNNEDYESQLENALQCAANVWGNLQSDWAVYEKSFVNQPEIYFRFAMALPKGSDKITAFNSSIGLFKKAVGITESPEWEINELDQKLISSNLAYWTAQSLIARSRNQKSDAGHDAAKLVMHLEKRLRTFALQPFAAARFGDRYQLAMRRWSLVLEFCCSVSDGLEAKDQIKIHKHIETSGRVFLALVESYPNTQISKTFIERLHKLVQMDSMVS